MMWNVRDLEIRTYVKRAYKAAGNRFSGRIKTEIKKENKKWKNY